jgi:hypothetical protein
MPGLLFSTDDKSVYQYDKIIRDFFRFDFNAYKIIKHDIEKNRDLFSSYLKRNHSKHEKHKRNLMKMLAISFSAFIISMALIFLFIELFYFYTDNEKKIEITFVTFLSSISLGFLVLPFLYSREKSLDNIDILIENAKYSIKWRNDSCLIQLSKESPKIGDYLSKRNSITIFHYYGIMLYAKKNHIRSAWEW